MIPGEEAAVLASLRSGDDGRVTRPEELNTHRQLDLSDGRVKTDPFVSLIVWWENPLTEQFDTGFL